MIAERKRFFAAQRAAEQRSKPPTKSQIMNRMKRTGENQSKESAKRQKMEDDAKKEELRAHLDIISGDNVAIIKANGSTKSYKIFTEMLDDFDRQDVLDLYRLVKESWRLFDSCGVHVLLMNTGIAIHMLEEKTYPLTQEMLSRMLSGKLEVDNESEMAFKLLRYCVLVFDLLWSLVSAGTNTPYLLDGYGILVFRIVIFKISSFKLQNARLLQNFTNYSIITTLFDVVSGFGIGVGKLTSTSLEELQWFNFFLHVGLTDILATLEGLGKGL
ncbi:hypothetical protein Tco_0336684 [Tanacetum coccineum]